MKYVVSLLAAIATTLAIAGTALAKVPTSARHGVRLASPAPIVWFDFVHRVHPPKPPRPRAARRHGPVVRRVVRHRVARHAQPHAIGRTTTTLSIYEQTANRHALLQQGCAAARRHESGVVVLDFGKPTFARGGYGTITFSDRFASNHGITNAMLGWAKGYSSCLPSGSRLAITLARGTSNYHPSVPSAYTAGLRWGRETNRFAQILRRHSLARHVASAAADDAEPAWDPHFRKTRDFVHGYRQAVHGHPLYDYGSLDGGIGSIWSARQAFFVAGGVRETRALPEIYYASQAKEWAQLARVAASRFHRDVRFAGVMTQGSGHCRCGFRPIAAHHALKRALESYGVRATVVPRGGTNIIG